MGLPIAWEGGQGERQNDVEELPYGAWIMDETLLSKYSKLNFARFIHCLIFSTFFVLQIGIFSSVIF